MLRNLPRKSREIETNIKEMLKEKMDHEAPQILSELLKDVFYKEKKETQNKEMGCHKQ